MKIDKDIEKFSEVRNRVRYSWLDLSKKVDYWSVENVVRKLLRWSVYDAVNNSVEGSIRESI